MNIKQAMSDLIHLFFYSLIVLEFHKDLFVGAEK